MEDEAMEETETDEISPDSFYETMDEEDSNLKADSEIINGDNHQNLVKMIAQEDTNHFMINKTRRCFLYHNQYFQLDIYKEPCHERCAVRKNII